MKSVIVVGANGFIGSKLCSVLVKNGIHVYAIVRSHESDTERLNEIKTSPYFSIVYKDMHRLQELVPAFQDDKIDALYFLSWQGIAKKDRSDYNIQLDNIKCMMDAVVFIKQINCPRFIGAGSIAEIDMNDYLRMDGSIPDVESIYSTAKIAAHYMSKALCIREGIEHIWAYIANVYGEGDKSNNFINYVIRMLQSDGSKDFTAGEQYRDFTHVNDIVQGLYKIGISGKNNYSYFIGSGKPRKLKEYINIIRDEINPSIKLNFGAIPFNGTLVPIDAYDSTKTMEDTGYCPEIEFKQGIDALLNCTESQHITSE